MDIEFDVKKTVTCDVKRKIIVGGKDGGDHFFPAATSQASNTSRRFMRPAVSR